MTCLTQQWISEARGLMGTQAQMLQMLYFKQHLMEDLKAYIIEGITAYLKQGCGIVILKKL